MSFQGFGGRSLCLSRQDPLEPPYEIAVVVKLDDESGAAGLVFHSDGQDRHYGFYPTAGKLRLTIIDPAAHYGDREVDLAMTELFGRFDAGFYSALTSEDGRTGLTAGLTWTFDNFLHPPEQ